jgi:hypothetical protein
MDQRLTAILPCNDLEQAQAFFERLGFRREEGPDDYRMPAHPVSCGNRQQWVASRPLNQVPSVCFIPLGCDGIVPLRPRSAGGRCTSRGHDMTGW